MLKKGDINLTKVLSVVYASTVFIFKYLALQSPYPCPKWQHSAAKIEVLHVNIDHTTAK